MPDITAPDSTAPAAPLQTASQLMKTPAAKVGLILVLILLMQAPLLMVSGLITEREARQGEVLADFQRGWGPEQVVAGPVLKIPYTWRNPAVAHSDLDREVDWVRIPASHLHVDAKLDPETRRRGLFHATVYTAAVTLSGSITIPALTLKNVPSAVIDWAGAQIVTGASDLRGMAPGASIEWNGVDVPLHDSDAGHCGLATLEAPANLGNAPAPGTTVPFKASMALRGTQAFWLAPNARQIDMHIASSWPTPSFAGTTLPTHHDESSTGFEARWDMAGQSNEAAAVLQGCSGSGTDANSMDGSGRSGVVLQEAVPVYVMVDRAAKYSVLFLALSYLTLFLFETLSGVRIHLVQYGLVGLSVSLFGLLLISVAEPLGFTASYVISTAAVMAQASLYTLSVVRRWRLAAVFAGVLGALFAFLYVVLSLDAYALLAGTTAVFAVLSAVMLVTRRVSWAAAPAS